MNARSVEDDWRVRVGHAAVKRHLGRFDDGRSEAGGVERGDLELPARIGREIQQIECRRCDTGRGRAEKGHRSVFGTVRRGRGRDDRGHLSDVSLAGQEGIEGQRLDRAATRHPDQPPRWGQPAFLRIGLHDQRAAGRRGEGEV